MLNVRARRGIAAAATAAPAASEAAAWARRTPGTVRSPFPAGFSLPPSVERSRARTSHGQSCHRCCTRLRGAQSERSRRQPSKLTLSPAAALIVHQLVPAANSPVTARGKLPGNSGARRGLGHLVRTVDLPCVFRAAYETVIL